MKIKLILWIIIMIFLIGSVNAANNLDLRGQTVTLGGNYTGYDNIYLEGATITINSSYGYVKLQSKYTITANSSTSIDGKGAGASAGATSGASFCDGADGGPGEWGAGQGEGGDGARCSGSSNGAQGGGGGGHNGTGGIGGEGEYFGGAHCTAKGSGGSTINDFLDLLSFFWAPAGGNGGCGTGSTNSKGGEGGGSLLLESYNISIQGIIINVSGKNGGSNSVSEYAGAGGGSAGTIVFNSSILEISSSIFNINGGDGGASTSPSVGGGGGGSGSGGVIKYLYNLLTNSSVTLSKSAGTPGSSTEGSAGTSGSEGVEFYYLQTEWEPPQPTIESNYTNPTNIQYGNTFNITSTASDGDGGELTFYWYVTKPDGTISVNNQTSAGCVNNNGTSNRTCWSPSVIATGSSAVGTWNWNYTVKDTLSGETTVSGSFEVKGTSVPNILSPLNNTASGENSEVFMCSGSSSPFSTINYEFYLDTVNGTTLVQNSTSITYTFDLTPFTNRTTYYWRCRANINGNTNQSDFTNTFTYIVDRRSIIGEITTYNSIVEESNSETFISNITVNDEFINDLYSSTFIYDNTNYTATVSKYNNTLYQAEVSIQIPQVTVSGTVKTFNWSYVWDTKDLTQTGNMSIDYTQTVNKLAFNNCSGGDNVTMNFTFWDENDFTSRLTNASFKGTFNIYKGSGEVFSNYSFDVNNTESVQFCLPINSTYQVNADVEYSKGGYDIRNYYLYNATLTNVTSEINLYLLEISLGSGIKFVVDNNIGDLLQDRYVKIQRRDLGDDTYKLVAVAKSDENGEDYVYLRKFDAQYRFIVEYLGVVELTTEPRKISEDTVYLTVGGDPLDYLNIFEQISFSLTNTSSIFRLTYTDTTGLASNYCLEVWEIGFGNSSRLDQSCLTTASGTIISNFSQYGNGTYMGKFYVKVNPPKILATLEVTYNRLQKLSDLVGKDGVMMAMFLIGTVSFIGLFNPVAAIVTALLGVIFTTMLGLLSYSGGAYTAVISLVIVGSLIIWRSRR